MQFKNIIGQEHVISRWKNAYYRRQLHPIVLLQGHEGAGTLPLAVSFAQFLLCEKHHSPNNTANLFSQHQDEQASSTDQQIEDSCGNCGSCKKIGSLSHPDLHFFFPVISADKVGGKEKRFAQDYITEWKSFLEENPYGNLFDWTKYAGDDLKKQPNISAKECANFLDVLGKKPYEGSRKVIIFWLPEFLEREANRLLKVLEEPPEDTYIFFVTMDSKLLLPTLLSRCLFIGISQPSDEAIKNSLLPQYPSHSEKDMDFAITMAKGNLRIVHNLLRMNEDTKLHMDQLILSMLDALLEQGPARQVEWINHISNQGRESIKHFFSILQFYIESYWRSQNTAVSPSNDIPHKEQNLIFERFKQIGMDQYADVCSTSINQSLIAIERNSNIKLELHHLIIQWYTLFKEQLLLFP